MVDSNKTHINLCIKNLSIGYKDKSIVENITFSGNEKDLIAIIGVNGVGKSTLLKTLAQMLPKLSGEIGGQQKELEHYTPIELASLISVVLTEGLASKDLSVMELIALGRQPYTNWLGSLKQEDKKMVQGAIQDLDLVEIQHKKCYELSDGQLQRVLIARALAQDTKIILLDEPTSHLDLYHKVQILKLLKTIAKNRNKTIVYTTHEIEMAIQLCDKILLLNKKENPFGEPCELIEQGVFESLFPKDTVKFDATSGTFKIKK
ncbi:ABC transporter ATP-binding protein [Cytophaga sp. FL35]|uniref:ABC transporter ATP-binding protein n=1 Tax=Cytophaga sp. FL35 TaxID=1904456 RepID=UPI00165358A1|nr:ABC transporter ATP-binding protein [Cytophaga sp. FL35]MBC6998637.1 ABC transporter ATP-binding protein [Cytophaga sp. FL35]